MATPDGRVAFEAGGRTRVLHFTTNRVCLLEDKTGRTPLDLAIEIEMNPKVSTIRAMFWAGLGEGDMTLEAAGALMDEIGRTNAIQYARDAFHAAFPPRDDGERAGDDANPQTAAAG